MFKKLITNKAYFWGGLSGVLASLSLALLNYLNPGKCIQGGRLGTQLCGGDIYIYYSLMIAVSTVAMWGGTRFSKK